MENNPLEMTETGDARASRLNTWVAITVALLATFIGVTKVKDDNIVQAMQQAQADKLDDWAFYQARNIREEIARAELSSLEIERGASSPVRHAAYDTVISRYQALEEEQATKKRALQEKAEQDQKTYDALNYRDDQFDLADALLAIAISMLALTSLTRKRWLFWVAMVPTAFGLLMGLAGLFSWHVHPNAIASLLS